ncbi:hypothetical protein HYE68_000161 [Fusarium pseudograminearum]|uniref:F-box domain-containing protein n=1 Tax=Fusarium pseudograminearum (strain CS3096) TaxID=1028729 RepID=K3VXI0_FUSPC|nr:hypothetical protein FPSE_10860 [Fusarium pseudograminearum CS3096]EKJ68935.1 hypothetical protein FPSE_10860 [Fusarium pseudograminearum CS3096]QPC69409.1 hypothetical protein HYE68_000161 [Fusarium pseudograminearum]
MPILFHCSNAHLPSRYIFNVLLYQPDLAQYTSILDLHSSMTFVPDSSALLKHMAAKDIDPSVFESRICWKSVGASLLMSICSNITSLALNDDSILALLEYSPSLWGTFECPQLKYLECQLNTTDERIFDVLLSLLHASPTLDVLILSTTKTDEDWAQLLRHAMYKLLPPLNNVAEIQALWCLVMTSYETSGRETRDIIIPVKNIRTFKYSVDASSEVSSRLEPELVGPRLPNNTFRALTASAVTLKCLTIDNHEIKRDFYSRSMFVSPQQIRQFYQLDTLEIRQSCYCRHERGKKKLEEEDWNRNTYLADFLPTTVEHLIILWKPDRTTYRCLDCVLYLGQRAVAGDFPMLKSVVVQCRIPSAMMHGLPGQDNGEYAGISEEDDAVAELEGPARRLREAFEGSDVATAFRIWSPVDKTYVNIDGEGGVEKFDL